MIFKVIIVKFNNLLKVIITKFNNLFGNLQLLSTIHDRMIGYINNISFAVILSNSQLLSRPEPAKCRTCQVQEEKN